MPLVLVKSDPRAREKPCLRCGYSLRKLADVKHCPECGLSVWISLSNNITLDWSKPSWLWRMAQGAWVMAAAQLLALVALGFVTIFGVRHSRSGLSATQVAALLAMILGGYLILYHAGLLLLCWEEKRYPDRWAALRWAGRIVAALGVLMGMGLFVRSLWRVRLGSGLFVEGGFWAYLIGVVAVASSIATLSYLRKMAQRLPSSRLSRICGYLLFIPLLSLIGVYPIFAIYLLLELSWLIFYLPWIYLPATTALFICFGIYFERAARAAESNWASNAAG